jgi:phenylacetyl-CoA:acceptor oxidoreductase subunit 2
VLLAFFAALILLRAIVWIAYRRKLGLTAAPGANAALERAGRVLQVAGTLLPLALLAGIAAGAIPAALVTPVAAIAGLAAAAAGVYAKYTIVTGAGFNQGFALVHLPVRGVRAWAAKQQN